MNSRKMAKITGIDHTKIWRWDKRGLYKGARGFDLDGEEIDKRTVEVAMTLIMETIRSFGIGMKTALPGARLVYGGIENRKPGLSIFFSIVAGPTGGEAGCFTAESVEIYHAPPEIPGWGFFLLDVTGLFRSVKAALAEGGKLDKEAIKTANLRRVA